MRVKLLHKSNHPDASGNVGAEINCPDELAKRWIASGGAVEIEPAPEPAPTVRRVRRKAAEE
jgi:hypothetical protein